MEFRDILHQYWGYTSFKGIQEEIINSISSKRDTLGLMPTGGGKSITFQVPGLAMRGTCIVVTPLVALMKDQVSELRRRGITAVSIYSGMPREAVIQTLENCILGETKFLYISPERISLELFQAKMQRLHVNFIVVDEAHCISQWGHDFRPSYLEIVRLRQMKPDAPVLALTATATKRVADDIMDSLSFKERNIIRMSFARKELAYIVNRTENKDAELLKILKETGGSAIVYTRSRQKTRDIAEMLCAHGLKAVYYNAGLSHAVRNDHQRKWTKGEVKVMVATNAFGMGINKPDVRVVVHVDCPDSIEAYFQEAGRAGRDGNDAQAILLYTSRDKINMVRRIKRRFPPKEYIINVYEHLAYFFEIASGAGLYRTFSFDIDGFCRVYHMFPADVIPALHLLQQAGYIIYNDDPDDKARLKFIVERDELYRINDVSGIEDKVITKLLRTYPGLFADYVHISETLLAQSLGLNPNDVYMVLRSLSTREILHFIPQRTTPYITYTRSRLDPDEIIIPRSIYEERMKQAEEHSNAIIKYMENDGECRSRQLLAYFNEEAEEDCGRCDVCVHNNKKQSRSLADKAAAAIENILSDGNRHALSELETIPLRREFIEDALRKLVSEEIVEADLGGIRIRKSG